MTAANNKTSGRSRAYTDIQDTGKSRIPGLIFSILFFACCLAPAAAYLAGIETPNLEKRTLAPKPSFTVNEQVNIDFTEEFDAWFSDSFPLRSYLISGWHDMNSLLPNNIFSDRVVSGSDDWLFFADTLNDHLGFDQFSEIDMARLRTVIELQEQWLSTQDIAFIFTVAPNKNSVYPEYMPTNYIANSGKDKATLLTDAEIASYVDLFSLLREHAAKGDAIEDLIYHQDDSHWNNTGAKLAATVLMAQAEDSMSADLPEELMPGQPVEYRRDWQGDLAVMLYPSGPGLDWQHYYTEVAKYRYTRPIRSLEDMKIITSSNSGQHNLLMFRDSFANALIPMLSPVFEKSLYSRAMPADYRLIEEAEAELVILEIVERNLRNIIDYAPIMPAKELDRIPSSLTANKQEPLMAAESDITFYRSEEGELIRFGAKFNHEDLQDGVRVIIETDEAFYEAFPIIDQRLQDSHDTQEAAIGRAASAKKNANSGSDDSGYNSGFTITLEQEADQKLQESGQLRIHVYDGSSWIVTTLADRSN